IPPITFIVGKDLEHKMPPEYMAKAEAEYQKHVAKTGKEFTKHQDREEVTPPNIRFVTYTTKYGGTADDKVFDPRRWLIVTAMERHYERTLIEGTWDSKKPVVKTTNVRGFMFGWGLSLDQTTNAKQIIIDGQTLDVPMIGVENGIFGRHFL